ncbi:prepilin-type N-terminal cleavage/methylation domain-containing protein [Patescibacteria group bacterium]|nr:prepilin-type N-terminal cleavage/methylation domain-containing protein [Patescibacteria group bacterium]
MIGDKKNQKGFSLIEVVVSTGIFAIFFIIIIDIFITTNNTQNKIKTSQNLKVDVKNILEKIILDIKSSEILYDFYISSETQNYIIQNPDYRLALERDDKNVYYRLGTENCYEGVTTCIEYSEDGTSWDSLTSRNINVEIFDIYISPKSNPFAYLPLSNADCLGDTYNGNGACECSSTSDCYLDQLCDAGICQNPEKMPIVTLVIRATSINSKEEESIEFQSTTSTRKYLK